MKYAPLLLIVLIPAAFVAFWCLIVKGLSLMGWQRLATHFQVPAPLPGPRLQLGQARLGGVSYKGVIQARVAAGGLGLSTGFPFGIGHPPLLIPWSALGPFETQKFLWATAYTTSISTPGGAVSLSFSSADLLAAIKPWLRPE